MERAKQFETIDYFNVGLDLDGVQNKLDYYMKTKGIPYFSKLENKTNYKFEYNSQFYDIEQIFNCTRKDRNNFWSKYVWYYCMFYEAREYASWLVNQIITDGNTPLLITARVYVDRRDMFEKASNKREENEFLKSLFLKASALPLEKTFRLMIYFWLNRNDIVFNKKDIYFCSEINSPEEKCEIIIDKNVRYMYEDKPENIEKMRKIQNLLTLVPNADYNQDVYSDGTKVIRINSLKEGYYIMMNDAMDKKLVKRI